VAPAIATVRNAKQQDQFVEHEWRMSLERIGHACVNAEASGPGPSIDILGCDEHQRLAKDIRTRSR
jgi:hypothetical protein